MSNVEEEPELDFTQLKKKKKKTKKLVALDDDDEEVATPSTDAVEPTPTGGDDDDDLGLDLKRKKKKKGKGKTPAFAIEDDEPAVDDIAVPVVVADDLSRDLVFPQRKKRRRIEKIPEEFAENTVDLDFDDDKGDVAVVQDTAAWADSDRDYHYTELLDRVFDIIRAKNPVLAQGEKRRFVMKPPSVIKVGSKKSGFINFVEICKMMHRPPDHVLGFLLTELGTSGTLDGSNSLILKGRFQQKNMENVLRRYIREYVTCHTCKSPDTIMSKEKRLFFLTCETCGARNSVSSIKEGFQAVVGKRSRLRAKEQ